MKRYRLLLCLIPAIGLFLLSSCGRSGNSSSTGTKGLAVGVVAPFEGPNAHIGKMIFNSVKLSFDENPVKGLSIRLIKIDTRSDPATAVSSLQGTVGTPDLVALIAFYHSSTALAGKPIIQEAKLPTLIYSASNPKVTEDAPYYFRLVPTDDNQAVVLAGFARKLGKRIAILYYADEYGKGLADGIRGEAVKGGLEVIDEQSYDAQTNDFRPLLTVLKGKEPDVIVICGFVEKSIAILNQAAEKGLRAKFLAGDGTFNEEQLIQGAGQNAEGVYVAAPYVFDESNSRNKAFLESYWKHFGDGGERRKPATWSAFAADAAAILSQAFRQELRTRESIHNYLRNMNAEDRAYDGITGKTYFNPRGDAVGRQFRLAVVKGKKFEAVK